MVAKILATTWQPPEQNKCDIKRYETISKYGDKTRTDMTVIATK